MDTIKVFITKKGRYTMSKTQAAQHMVVLGNEHYARDNGGPTEVTLWGVQNKDTGKLMAVTSARRTARKYRGHRSEPCRVVALAKP